MAAPQAFIPRNRLAAALAGSHGDAPADLVAEANRLVAEKSNTIRAFVTEAVARIVAQERCDDDVLFARCDSLSGEALDVADVAAAAGLEAAGEIARGIAVAVQALRESGAWRPEAVRLHIAALRAIGTSEATSAQAASTLLAELCALRATFGAAE
ncbi:MAG: hypothetical protein JSR45_04885 [Proteobacteria bacterium]|nr:hypothetical protein [Pseudomonadota bacterium]